MVCSDAKPKFVYKWWHQVDNVASIPTFEWHDKICVDTWQRMAAP